MDSDVVSMGKITTLAERISVFDARSILAALAPLLLSPIQLCMMPGINQSRGSATLLKMLMGPQDLDLRM